MYANLRADYCETLICHCIAEYSACQYEKWEEEKILLFPEENAEEAPVEGLGGQLVGRVNQVQHLRTGVDIVHSIIIYSTLKGQCRYFEQGLR